MTIFKKQSRIQSLLEIIFLYIVTVYTSLLLPMFPKTYIKMDY